MGIGAYERDDDLGFRRAIARYVPGEFVHVGHPDRDPLLGRRSDNAATERDSNASESALERAKHQFSTFEQVKTRPI